LPHWQKPNSSQANPRDRDRNPNEPTPEIIVPYPRWVISRHNGPFASCPLCPKSEYSSVQVGCPLGARSGPQVSRGAAVRDSSSKRTRMRPSSTPSKLIYRREPAGRSGPPDLTDPLQHVDAERPALLHQPIRRRVRIDAQGQEQGIERHLHHPGGAERIAHLPVGRAHHVNALCQALKQGRDGTAHASLFISVCGLS
jgi:hypothetical protein